MEIFRIEHKDTKAGMWRNYDGSYNGVIETLTEGEASQAPMPRTPQHDKGGRKWFSGVKSLEQLNSWFSKLDIKELKAKGYVLCSFQCNEYVIMDNEILFTREGVTSSHIIE